MSRIAAIVVLAAICLTLFGVDRSALAAQQLTTPEQVSQQVARVKVGDIVEVVRPDGTKIRGVLVAKTDDSITVEVYRNRAFRRPELVGTETLALASVRDVTKPLTSGQITAIAAVAVVGFMGLCATAVLGERAHRPPIVEGSGPTGDSLSSADENVLAPESAESPDGSAEVEETQFLEGR